MVMLLNTVFYESEKRGTPDFPIEFYSVGSSHPRYRMRTQWHNDVEIDRVVSGKLTFRLNDEQFVMEEGDCVVIPGGVVHGAEGESCEYECIVFSPSVLYATQKMRSNVRANLKKPVFLKKDEDIAVLFESIKTEENDFRVVGSLYNIIQKALSGQKSASASGTEYAVERIKPAISFIEENYMRDISLAELAKTCSMSPNYFCRFFKEVTGQTAGKYITAARIEAACEKLIGGMSVTDCAFACGFNDVSYFIRVFKRETSLSPKKYIKRKNDNAFGHSHTRKYWF